MHIIDISYSSDRRATIRAGFIIQETSGFEASRYLSTYLWHRKGADGLQYIDGDPAVEGEAVAYCCFYIPTTPRHGMFVITSLQQQQFHRLHRLQCSLSNVLFASMRNSLPRVSCLSYVSSELLTKISLFFGQAPHMVFSSTLVLS